MNKIFLTIIALCGFTISLFAQGIEFREGSWKEMLALAKQENRLIFVDNYTSWCGPCKQMAKEIFPLKEVGDFYNKHFICYKLDCEKGDGVEVAKTYQINSFPTYLFVDGDGKLFYRSGGYMPLDKFIAEGETALEEFADKRTIEEWNVLYERKKNNASFVKDYIIKRNRSKLDNADILDQYVSIEKEKNLLTPDFLTSLLDGNVNAWGACADFIMSRWDTIRSITQKDDRQMAQLLQYSVGRYSYSKAVREKNEEHFNAFLRVNGLLVKKLGLNAEHEAIKAYSRFYADTDNRAKFEEMAGQHADILFEEEKGVLQRDNNAFHEYLKNMIAAPDNIASMTPESLAFSLQFAAINESSSLSFAFRDLAADVAKLSDNRELLTQAMAWAMEAIILFDNFTNYETLAEVLFKMGYKKEALRQMEKALNKMPAGNDAISKRIHDKLSYIKTNQ